MFTITLDWFLEFILLYPGVNQEEFYWLNVNNMAKEACISLYEYLWLVYARPHIAIE